MSVFRQEEITLPSYRRGCHLITDIITQNLNLSDIKVGMANVFIKHTSASLTINEVRSSLIYMLNRTHVEHLIWLGSDGRKITRFFSTRTLPLPLAL